jgi:hypothetical protein
MLVIHRPGQPDEIISAGEFRRRMREIEEQDAGPTQATRNRSVRGAH